MSSLGLMPEVPLSDYIDADTQPISTLANLGTIHEDKTIAELSELLVLKHWNLASENIISNIDPEPLVACTRIREICEEHGVLPLKQLKDSVVVAFANPFSEEAKGELAQIYQSPIKQILAKESQIRNLQLTYFSAPIDAQLESSLSTNDEDSEDTPLPDFCTDISDARLGETVNRLCQKVLDDAFSHHCSAILLESQELGLDISFGLHGVVTHLVTVPQRYTGWCVAFFKSLAEIEPENFSLFSSDCRITNKGENAESTVSLGRSEHGIRMRISLEYSLKKIPATREIGFQDDELEDLRHILSKPGSFVLLTEAPLPWKKPNYYSLLKEMATPEISVVSVEQRVSKMIDGANQIKTRDTSTDSLVKATRAAIACEPDILFIDTCTIKQLPLLLQTLEETDISVLARMRGSDPHQTILNIKASEEIAPDDVTAIIVQDTVRSLCRSCCAPISKRTAEKHKALIQTTGVPPQALLDNRGCKECLKTGFQFAVPMTRLLTDPIQINRLLRHDTDATGLEGSEFHAFLYAQFATQARELLVNGVTSLSEIGPFLKSEAKLSKLLQEAVSKRSLKKQQEESSEPSNPRILLVEDDENIRALVSEILRLENFDVIEAKDGHEALDLVFAHDPALVITDLNMPKLSGRELLKTIQASEKTANTPVVVLTGENDYKAEVELLDLGARDFISKLVPKEILISRLLRALKS